MGKSIRWPIETMRDLYCNQKMSIQEIADELSSDHWQSYWRSELGSEYRPSQKIVNKVLKRSGIPLRSRGAPMERNGFWKGGIHIDRDGYHLQKVQNHPYATAKGYVRVHRLVMESKLGRYLTPSEVVHHRDDNPANNQIDNLELFETNALHISETMKGNVPSSRILKAQSTAIRTRRDWWPVALIQKWHFDDRLPLGRIADLLGKSLDSVSACLRRAGTPSKRSIRRDSPPTPDQIAQAQSFLATAGHQPAVCARR